MKSWLPGKESSPIGWADLAVFPLIVVLCIPSLMWFGDNWTIIGNDSARYLLAGSQFISGQTLEGIENISEYNGGHGPGLPALVGFLILLVGHNPEPLTWAARLIALLNPLLAYFLVKRISGPVAGLIAAALVTLFGFNATAVLAVNIDAPMLIFYLLSLLTLLAAIDRNSSPLSFLSGALLALSILTKESAFANLPLALLAVLLIDWDPRKALWHYLGVVLVSLPWWILAYSATGDVYLMDRLPAQLQLPVLIAAAVFVVLAVVAYASGMVDRFLASERRRRWSGWLVAIAWTVLLSGMLLATATQALDRLSFEGLSQYLADLLAPVIFVAPTLVVVVGYVVWKAVRERGAWTLIALSLLFQVPVCLLVTVEYWAPRQFLIPQTLVFCALAVLVVEAGKAALGERNYRTRLVGAVAAIALAVFLVVGSVERVQALLPEDLSFRLSGLYGEKPQEIQMDDWMAQNVPEGEHVLVIAEPAFSAVAIRVARAGYLVFLDGGQHELKPLQLDQEICFSTPNVPSSCAPGENSISRAPPDAIWVQSAGRCNVVSLTMSNLLDQMHRTDSDYVLISGSRLYPGILQVPPILQRSGAFEIAHAELAPRAGPGTPRSVVLLKRTGQDPKALRTQMNTDTLRILKRCEQARGQKLKSTFPNGIVTVPAPASRRR